MAERKTATRPPFIVGSVAFKLLHLFATKGTMPGFTVGDLIIALGEHPGRAIYQRMNLDLKQRGWKILHYKDDEDLHRYWMHSRERERAKRFLAGLVAQQKIRSAA